MDFADIWNTKIKKIKIRRNKMAQRAIPFNEVARRFALVRVPYNEPGLALYTPTSRKCIVRDSEGNFSYGQEKVIYFYANKQDVAEIIAEPKRTLPVAFRGKTDWSRETVTCTVVSDKITLESITKSIHEGLFGV
jgi:hypothetical protein